MSPVGQASGLSDKAEHSMFDSLIADGLGSGLGEKVAGYVIKGLAVAGAFLIGYFLGRIVAWGLDRWVFANKAPDPLKKAVALLTGVALAILVALIVFGEGGSGLFGSGGGDGQGKGQPTPADNGKAPPVPTPEPKKDEPKKDEPPKTPLPPAPGDVRVTILPSDEVKEGRFYLIDGDPVPKNFGEFKTAITARRKDAQPELKQVVFRFKSERFSQNNPVVRDVVMWLSSSGIGAPVQ